MYKFVFIFNIVMEPLNSLPRYAMFGIDDQDYKKARVVVLPVPYDSAVTYKSGAKDGPRAIIDASRNLEFYSYELKDDPRRIGIYTTLELAPNLDSPEKMAKNVKREVEVILDDGKVPMLLGGDHSITIGALEAFAGRKEISVVQFDAHTDSVDEMFGSRYTHASVMARAMEMHEKIVQVGIRNIDAVSAKRLDMRRIMFMDEVDRIGTKAVADKINRLTGKEVYITVDLDVIDPGEMPSTGTPEPGGMHWKELVDIIRRVAAKKNLAGMDITELRPIPYMHAPDFAAAKLAYLSLGYFMLKKR